MKHFQMVENISFYLYMHHTCFKCTNIYVQKKWTHEILYFVQLYNEPIKPISMMFNESLAILMCMCHFAKSNLSIVEQVRGAIHMKGTTTLSRRNVVCCMNAHPKCVWMANYLQFYV